MTPKALALLKKLIETDRWWRSRREAGEFLPADDRGVEISRIINGVDRRTAEQLVKLGVAETVQIRQGMSYIFLGNYNPYDEEEKHD